MLTSTQVHQMTVAMFGAAAGGYTEELQAFETLTSLGDFLATLDLATEKFADADTDLATARIIAGDFGLADNDEAVQQVIDWLEAGESLGTIYAAAIAYLSGDSVAADFEAAATAFNTSVDLAVEFSASNADEKDVAALQEAVTEATGGFTLSIGLAALEEASDALSAVLQGALDNADVLDEAEAIAVDADDITDAEADTAIDNALATLEGVVEGLVAGLDYSAQSEGLAAALIADQEEANADALAAAEKTLATAEAAVAKVSGLAAALAAEEAAIEAAVASQLAYDKAMAATSAAEDQFDLDNPDEAGINLWGGTQVGTTDIYEVIASDGETVLFTIDKSEDWYSFTLVADEADYPGLTAFVNAANTEEQLGAADEAADVAEALATRNLDYLDTEDAYAKMDLLIDEFVFTTPAGDVATAEEIDAEAELLDDKISALDALAAANGDTDYATAIAALKTAITGATDVEADIKAEVLAAYEAGYITLADKAAIDTAAATSSAAANTAVDANNWEARETAFDAAVTALDTAEDGTDALTTALVAAQDAISNDAETGVQDDIDTLAEALADLAAVVAIDEARTAAEEGVTDAEDAFADNGFTSPVTLDGGIELAGAEDDLFVAGTTDTEIRQMGVLGEDVLYVGDLTYNMTVIGATTDADEGTTALDEAGDDAALEFFLYETATAVQVHIEEKAFGSTSGTDTTVITLTGVALEDITVDGGFITVA